MSWRLIPTVEFFTDGSHCTPLHAHYMENFKYRGQTLKWRRDDMAPDRSQYPFKKKKLCCLSAVIVGWIMSGSDVQCCVVHLQTLSNSSLHSDCTLGLSVRKRGVIFKWHIHSDILSASLFFLQVELQKLSFMSIISTVQNSSGLLEKSIQDDMNFKGVWGKRGDA